MNNTNPHIVKDLRARHHDDYAAIGIICSKIDITVAISNRRVPQ